MMDPLYVIWRTIQDGQAAGLSGQADYPDEGPLPLDLTSLLSLEENLRDKADLNKQNGSIALPLLSSDLS